VQVFVVANETITTWPGRARSPLQSQPAPPTTRQPGDVHNGAELICRRLHQISPTNKLLQAARCHSCQAQDCSSLACVGIAVAWDRNTGLFCFFDAWRMRDFLVISAATAWHVSPWLLAFPRISGNPLWRLLFSRAQRVGQTVLFVLRFSPVLCANSLSCLGDQSPTALWCFRKYHAGFVVLCRHGVGISIQRIELLSRFRRKAQSLLSGLRSLSHRLSRPILRCDQRRVFILRGLIQGICAGKQRLLVRTCDLLPGNAVDGRRWTVAS